MTALNSSPRSAGYHGHPHHQHGDGHPHQHPHQPEHYHPYYQQSHGSPFHQGHQQHINNDSLDQQLHQQQSQQGGTLQEWQPTGYGLPLSSATLTSLADAQQQQVEDTPADPPAPPPAAAPATPVHHMHPSVRFRMDTVFTQQLRGAHITVDAAANVWPWPRITARRLRIRGVLASGATGAVCDCGRSSRSNFWADSTGRDGPAACLGSMQQSGSTSTAAFAAAAAATAAASRSSSNRDADAVVAKVIYSDPDHPATEAWAEELFARERFCYWLVDGVVGFAQVLATGTVQLPSGRSARCLLFPKYATMLTAAAAEERLSIQQMRQVFKPVVQGLATLHSDGTGKGYLGMHLDLKPCNIMVDGHGASRICDFGSSWFRETPPDFDPLLGTYSNGKLVLARPKTFTLRYAQPSLVSGGVGSVLSDSFSVAACLAVVVVRSEGVLDQAAPLDRETGAGLEAWEQQLRRFSRGELWQERFAGEAQADVQQLLQFVRCCIGEGVAAHTAAQLLSTPWLAE